MIENYLKILEDSLRKKLVVLEEIIKYNESQEAMLKQENVSFEAMDANMEQKDELIQKILKLDEGFDALYDKLREQLLGNKELYKTQIKTLQDLITKVTEKSVLVQTQEARNKKLIEDYFTKEKSGLRQGRMASKAAYGYYKNMSNTNVVQPQIMDQKK